MSAIQNTILPCTISYLHHIHLIHYIYIYTQDIALSKQREEQLKASILKLQSTLATYKQETDKNLSQINELKQENDRYISKIDNNYTNDAIIRRLENERQYLKSQVTAELSLKHELQKALTHSQSQLNEIHNKLHNTIEQHNNINIQYNQQLTTLEQTYKNKLIELETDNNRLIVTHADLKETYLKNRELLRQLESSYEELLMKLKKQENENEINKQELEEVKTALDRERLLSQHMLQDAAAKWADREDQLTRQLTSREGDITRIHTTALATLQTRYDTLTLDLTHLTAQYNRYKATSTLVCKLDKYRISRLSTAFKTWHTTATVQGITLKFRDKVNTYESKWLEQSSLQNTSAVESMRIQLQSEYEAQKVQWQRDHDDIMFNMKSTYIHDKTQLEHIHQEKLISHIQQCNEDWNTKYNALTTKHEADIHTLKDTLHTEHIQAIDTLTQQYNTDKQKWNDAMKSVIILTRQEEAITWTNKIKQLESEYISNQGQHNNTIINLENEALNKFEILLKETKTKYKKKIIEKESEFLSATEILKSTHQSQLDNIHIQHNNEIKSIKTQYESLIKQQNDDFEYDKVRSLAALTQQLTQTLTSEGEERVRKVREEMEVARASEVEKWRSEEDERLQHALRVCKVSRWYSILYIYDTACVCLYIIYYDIHVYDACRSYSR